jgi:hypothetical protein
MADSLKHGSESTGYIEAGNLLIKWVIQLSGKFVIWLTTYNSMKMYGGVEVKLHCLLTQVLDGGERWVEQPWDVPRVAKSLRYPLSRKHAGSSEPIWSL